MNSLNAMENVIGSITVDNSVEIDKDRSNQLISSP